MVEQLYFEIRPSEYRRYAVVGGQVVTCRKCRKVIAVGRLVFESGFCYRCEHKRVLKDHYSAQGRIRRLDRDFKEEISE